MTALVWTLFALFVLRVAGQALVAGGFETYGHVMKGTGHGISPDGLGAALRFLKDRLPA